MHVNTQIGSSHLMLVNYVQLPSWYGIAIERDKGTPWKFIYIRQDTQSAEAIY